MIEAHIVRKVEGDIEFLLLKRSDKDIYPGVWQMVTGSILSGEKAYDAVLREIKEETGLIPDKLWVVPYLNSFYSRFRNHVCMVPVFSALIQGNPDIIISDEHVEYKWVNKMTAVKSLAWIGQRNSVEIIHEYLTNEINVLNFEEIKFK
jgi:dATP pyrophosphohydrolase